MEKKKKDKEIDLDKFRPTITRDKKTGDIIGTEFPDGRKFFGLSPSKIQDLTAAYLKGTGLGYAKEKETDEKIEVAEKEEIKEAGQQVSDFGKEETQIIGQRLATGETIEHEIPIGAFEKTAEREGPALMKDVFPSTEGTRLGEVDPVSTGLLAAGGAPKAVAGTVTKALTTEAGKTKLLNEGAKRTFQRLEEAFPRATKRELRGAYNKMSKMKVDEMVKTLEGGSSIAKKFIKFSKTPWGVAYHSASLLGMWYAADNLPFYAGQRSSKARDAYTFNEMPAEETISIMEDSLLTVKTTRTAMIAIMVANPLMAPVGAFFMFGNKEAKKNIELDIDFVKSQEIGIDKGGNQDE